MIHTEWIRSKEENVTDIELNCSNKLKFDNERKKQFDKIPSKVRDMEISALVLIFGTPGIMYKRIVLKVVEIFKKIKELRLTRL